MRLFQVIMAICSLLVAGYLLLTVLRRPESAPTDRKDQFLRCCQDVFALDSTECLAFMERWGGFMAK